MFFRQQAEFRRFRWWQVGVLTEPLLWSLYAAYAALPLAFAVMAIDGFSGIIGRKALHLLAISVIAGMVLSMIARVSLGHSGRPLQAHKIMSWCFVALMLSGLLRFALSACFPAQTLLGYQLSTALFTLAFVGFLGCYWNILTRARSDGKPG